MSDLIVQNRRPQLASFTGPLSAVFGAMFGFVVGNVFGNPWTGALAGAVFGAALAAVLHMAPLSRRNGRLGTIAACLIAGLVIGGTGGAVGGAIIGAILSWFVYWLDSGDYRAGSPIYATSLQVLWDNTFLLICGLIFFFLIAPLVPVMWLSFNAQDFFTFTPEMLNFDPAGYSLKHYRSFFGTEGNPMLGLILGFGAGVALAVVLRVLSGPREVLGWVAPILSLTVIGLVVGKLWGVGGAEWMTPLKNSLIIAPIATFLSVSFGTLAAIGLSQSHVPGRRAIMAILISPMIVPLIISATGMFFFYAPLGNWLEATLGLNQSFVGFVKVILAHAALGIPFVIITVTATLVGFDRSLTRAAANMGADPVTTFFRVQMPLILPGVISGGLFAFITSFDEVVVVLFVGSAQQQTLPWQMFTGLREQISPTILAAATILVTISILLLAMVELLRRRSERLRGMSPS
ncbi:ABC transporter permease subunit [Marivivens marinus]|uniref:ABC transporter permease n=1 Tax=Marivivens marinus TaxID=3110173 RepID=UPI003B8457BA